MSQTVLLTGASGFIAKHVLLKLLQAGMTVRASVRGREREAEVRAHRRPVWGGGVLTSPIAAIMRCDLPPGRAEHDDTDWSRANHPSTT